VTYHYTKFCTLVTLQKEQRVKLAETMFLFIIHVGATLKY